MVNDSKGPIPLKEESTVKGLPSRDSVSNKCILRKGRATNICIRLRKSVAGSKVVGGSRGEREPITGVV